jgi:hypothetical protein
LSAGSRSRSFVAVRRRYSRAITSANCSSGSAFESPSSKAMMRRRGTFTWPLSNAIVAVCASPHRVEHPLVRGELRAVFVNDLAVCESLRTGNPRAHRGYHRERRRVDRVHRGRDGVRRLDGLALFGNLDRRRRARRPPRSSTPLEVSPRRRERPRLQWRRGAEANRIKREWSDVVRGPSWRFALAAPASAAGSIRLERGDRQRNEAQWRGTRSRSICSAWTAATSGRT